MPCLQLFPPANPVALCHDHDYMKFTPEEQYLVDNKITQITREEVMEVEMSTRGQSKNRIWASTRTHHITSSNFGVICKATEKRDMSRLALKLVSMCDIKAAAILHGRKYESVAVEAFEKREGLKTHECGIFISTEHPQLAASPDRLIGTHACVEIKCPYSAREKKVTPQTVPYLKCVNGELTLDCKHDYFYQVQGQLLCSNRNLCYFVGYTFEHMAIVKVYRDDGFIEKMVEKLLSFFKLHFIAAVLNEFMYKDYYCYTFQY